MIEQIIGGHNDQSGACNHLTGERFFPLIQSPVIDSSVPSAV